MCKENSLIRRRIQQIGIWIGLGLFIWQLFQSVEKLINSKLIIHSYLPILIILFSGLAFNFLQMVNWSLILRGLNIFIPLKGTLKHFPRTFLPRYIPGSIWGYLSRGEWLVKNFNTDHKMNIYSSILEVLIPFSAALFLLSGYLSKVNFGLYLFSASFSILAMWYLFEFIRKQLPGHFSFSAQEYHFPLPRWLLGNLIFSINWALMGLMTMGLIAVFSESADLLSLWSVGNLWRTTLVFCAAWLGGFLVLFVPAGMGVREVLFRLLLVQFMGISSETALIVAVSSRFVSLLSEGIWLLVGMFIKDG